MKHNTQKRYRHCNQATCNHAKKQIYRHHETSRLNSVHRTIFRMPSTAIKPPSSFIFENSSLEQSLFLCSQTEHIEPLGWYAILIHQISILACTNQQFCYLHYRE